MITLDALKLHALAGGTSIISSIAASIAGYKSRKNSLRGGPNSSAGTSAVAAGSFSALMPSVTSARGRRASSRANSASGAPGVGPAYASLHSRTLTASAVAEKGGKGEEGSLHGSDSLSGSSDTSSNFGAEYLPGSLGMTFVPITLVFRDLR